MGIKAISVDMRAIGVSKEANSACKKASDAKNAKSVKNELKIKC